MNGPNNKYRWVLKDGSEAELSFSGHFDNLIRKYRNNEEVESIFIMNCGITYIMPSIMRYCFEQKINLRERKFLRNLPSVDSADCDISEFCSLSDLQIPLRSDAGTVRSVNKNLVIYSRPKVLLRPISFSPGDVAELVEGTIKYLDYDGVRGTQTQCMCVVQYYHECLDKGLLSCSKPLARH